MNMSTFPKFQVYKSLIKNEFFYQLKSDSYEIILCGSGYTSKLACFKDIESVKVNSQIDLRYQKSNRLNFFTFTVEASDGKVIGQGESYNSSYARDNAIDMVKNDAFIASIEDLTEYTRSDIDPDSTNDTPTDSISDTPTDCDTTAGFDSDMPGNPTVSPTPIA